MESESFRADPGVLDIVLAVVEDLAIKVLVGVVPAGLAHAIELGLLQELGQAVWFLFLIFKLFFHFLDGLLLQSCGALVLVVEMLW